MLDRLFPADSIRSATDNDVNIPRFLRSETRLISAWAVTLQATVFLALVAVPLVLINDVWAAPAGTGLTAALAWTMRHSSLRYQRVRVS